MRIGNISDISKSLVVVIDLYNHILNDAVLLDAISWYHIHYVETMKNLRMLLTFCNKLNMKVQEILSFGERNSLIYDYSFIKHVDDYSQFSHIFFCGCSLDRCVTRYYFEINHDNKILIKNCTLMLPEYAVPIDWVKKGMSKPKKFNYLENPRFNNLVELKNYVDKFLEVNEIDWIEVYY